MTIAERIQHDIDTNRVMLFMKGAPEFPMCGFSSQVVAVLKHLNIEFGSADVLQDMELRQGIKEFSDWPTLHNSMWTGNLLADAISSWKCLNPVNCNSCFRAKNPDFLSTPEYSILFTVRTMSLPESPSATRRLDRSTKG